MESIIATTKSILGIKDDSCDAAIRTFVFIACSDIDRRLRSDADAEELSGVYETAAAYIAASLFRRAHADESFTSFRAGDITVSGSDATENAADTYRDLGYAILRGFLDDESFMFMETSG